MNVSNTEEKFRAAVEIIKNLPKSGPIKPSNEVKLKFYSYYKQATEGPCELPKPGFWDIVNRAKWDAWNKLENMSKEEAMKNYVDEFVEIMKETIPKDPESVNEFYAIMGPYVELVPEEIRSKHGMVNGNGTKFLNNNTEEYLESHSNTSKIGKPMKDYRKEPENHADEALLAPFINGHSFNGNDSDSEEFSDTLEQVNESETEEPHMESFSVEENQDSSAISSTKGSIINVRGGGEQKLGSGDTSSPAAGSSSSRGNRSSRPVRSPENPLQYLSNNSNISGAGGSRRSGGQLPVEIAADANEQLALAVIRLQHIMEQVVVRLDSLETLLTQRQPVSKEVISKKSSYWSFFGISPKAALLILAWPIIVQWLIYLIRKRNRRL